MPGAWRLMSSASGFGCADLPWGGQGAGVFGGAEDTVPRALRESQVVAEGTDRPTAAARRRRLHGGGAPAKESRDEVEGRAKRDIDCPAHEWNQATPTSGARS